MDCRLVVAGFLSILASGPENADRWPPLEEGRGRVVLLRGSPVFLESDPDARAVVVMVDRDPVGSLENATYLAVSLAPGEHLLWTWKHEAAVRVLVEAGATHGLDLHIWRQPGAAGAATLRYRWEPIADAGLVGEAIRDRRLAAAGPADLASISRDPDLERRYAKALGRAADDDVARPSAGAQVALPVTFPKVWYRPEVKGRSLVAYSGSGALTVSRDRIAYQADDYGLSLSATELRDVRHGRMKGDRYNDWVILTFEHDGQQETIGLRDGSRLGHGKDTDKIYATLVQAAEIARAGSNTAPGQKSQDPVQVANELAQGLENALQGRGETPDFERIERAAARLDDHLKQHPEDTDAILASVRLELGRVLHDPTLISRQGPASKTPDPFREQHAALDRLVALRPEDAEARYLKARLYGIRVPEEDEGGRLRMAPLDLEAAIRLAGEAVERDPGQARFREALALYLVDAGRETAAREVLAGPAFATRPIRVLLVDLERFPIPSGATLSWPDSESLGQMQLARGRFADYPQLRTRVYLFPGRASDVRAALLSRFKDLELFDIDGLRGQFFRFRGEDLVPAHRERDVPEDPQDGILFAVIEVPDGEPGHPRETPAGLPLPEGPHCVVHVTNLRTRYGGVTE
jgi:hypothetical protein